MTRFCRHGHDKSVVGVVGHGTCAVCAKESSRRHRQSAKGRARYRAARDRWVHKNHDRQLAMMKAWRDRQKLLYGSLSSAFWCRQVRNSL